MKSYCNVRGIKLISYIIRVWGRAVSEQQYGFMPRKSATDAMLPLRVLMENYREGQKELHCVYMQIRQESL